MRASLADTAAAPAVAVHELSRRYVPARGGNAVLALDRVDLTVDRSEVHGLLGPNGAGKTTLCKILATILLPTSGTARVAGHHVEQDASRVRRTVGLVVGGERGLYSRLSARQNLSYWAALAGVPRRRIAERVTRLLDRVGLEERAEARVETYSLGMKQRLHLARGLVGDPEVLLLDEPTNGLDPVAAREFRTLVRELQSEGKSLLMTTHDMAEAEAVCDRVSLIDHGRLLRTESPRTIGSWIGMHERVDVQGLRADGREALRDLPGVSRLEELGHDTLRVHTRASGAAQEVLRVAVMNGATSLTTSRPTLEEVYLNVIGNRGLRL